MTLKFSDLNPLGRAIIVVVAVLTFGLAAVSFATSYGALYAWARDTGLYSASIHRSGVDSWVATNVKRAL